MSLLSLDFDFFINNGADRAGAVEGAAAASDVPVTAGAKVLSVMNLEDARVPQSPLPVDFFSLRILS